jgi:hypothetical protein
MKKRTRNQSNECVRKRVHLETKYQKKTRGR